MSIIKKIRRTTRTAAKKPAAKMSRRVYASLRERIQGAIAETMKEHKSLVKANFKNKARCADWLDQVVGDAMTDTAEEVYEDLPDIAEVMVEEPEGDEFPPAASDDQDEDDMPVAGDDEVEEPEVEDEEPEAAGDEEPVAEDELEQVASELEDIKGRALAQAKRLAKAGDFDNAARLKLICNSL